MADDSATQVAETYYDSDSADRFYFQIWGGEDIHVGLYDDTDVVHEASRLTVETIAKKLRGLNKDSKVLDLGAGYGGAARYLARSYGCHVTCLNISETQNQRNRELNKEQGLADRIRVIHGTFENIPEPDGAYDYVWSQDSFLHSGERKKAIAEARRVLKKGGELIFTDPMQADDCPEGVLQPVLDRIHLSSLGSFGFYRQTAKEVGLEEIEIEDLSHQLGNHYSRVRDELSSRYDEMVELSGQEYVDRMLQGLKHWVDGQRNGYLAWGILHFRAV